MKLRGATLCVLLLTTAWTPARGQDGARYAAADSADMVDEALAGVDPADVADVAEALEDEVVHASGSTARARSAFFRFETVSGYRSSTQATAGVRGVAASFRRTGGSAEHWIDVRSRGWLERVTVGGLRVRSGESLVLGARYSRFGGATPVRGGGLEATPSLSRYRPKHGVAAAFRHRSNRLFVAAWDVPDGSAGRWASLEHAGATGSLAVSAGRLREGVDRGGRALDAVSLWGGRDVSGDRYACEVAWLGVVAFAVARADVRAGGDWTAQVYSGPMSASGGVATSSGERERGASLTRRGDWEGWTSTLSVHTALRRDVDEGRLRRRIDARVVHAWESGRRFDVSARYDLDSEREVPSGLLVESVETDRSSSGRVRVRLDLPAWQSLRFRYHAQATLEPGARPGFIAGVDARHESRHLSLRVSVSDFALPGRSSGYVSRPGIAGYESVSTVQRRGSDVSARAALRLGYGASLSLYAGVPWEREPRYLVSFNLTG